tara:strand:- start:99 stop:458 length:360 start_codon:yes stop_codon:yes gene_type:complete
MKEINKMYSYQVDGRMGEVLIRNRGMFTVTWDDANNRGHVKEKHFSDWNEARRFAKARRLANEFVMWFQDGQGRTHITGKKELNQYAKRFNFDADEVYLTGKCELRDDDGDIVGGVNLI